MLDSVASKNLQVVFDPVNLLSFDNHQEQERIITESFGLFGDRIAIIHAKDYIVENGRFRTASSGLGQLRSDAGRQLNDFNVSLVLISLCINHQLEAP